MTHKYLKLKFRSSINVNTTISLKRIILLALLFFTTVSITTAQVKIGENPSTINNASLLELESTSQGFLPPRMTQVQMDAIANPPEGLIVYCTDCSPKGTYQFDGAEWQPLIAGGNPNVSINCSVDGFTGSLVEGQAITTQTFSLTVTNSSFSTAGVAFNTTDLTLSGVAGITVSGVSPASATLNTAGDQAKVTYTLSGTPTGSGTLNAAIDIAGILACSANTTVISASDNILAQIGNEGDDPNVINSVVTVAQLNLITPALTGVTAGNETAYQNYIDANPNDFSSPATQQEVQDMIDAVNASQTVLAQIGNEGDDPDNVNSVVTVAELNTIIPALTGVNASYEAAYQNYIDANPNNFSSPATQPEVQAMITYVAANPPIPAAITLGTGESYYLASLYDQDYLPFTTPTGPAVTTAVAADGTNEGTTIDIPGSITTTGENISIPVTATGSGTLPAYTSTITIPANLTEDGISRDLTLSWASQAFTASTTSITATLAAVGGTLNAKKLDLNGGIGNNNLGVLMGTFNYPINNAGTTTSFEVRIISGIPDREFGDGVHDFIYLPVTNPTTGETWLNNNLGASYANFNHPDFNPAQQATSSTDDKAYGSWYQWGRYSDGHELINRNAGDPHATSGTTFTLSNTDQPPHDDFITTGTDWRNPRNDNLWQGVNGTNNPCPNGYRLPTEAELNTERASWSSNNSAGAFASPLKLPIGGWRITDGTIERVGFRGYYWSSTTIGSASKRLSTYNGVTYTTERAYSFSVRCIKD